MEMSLVGCHNQDHWVFFGGFRGGCVGVEQLFWRFPTTPPDPLHSPPTESSVWWVPGIGAHGWVAGISRPWGQILSRGRLARVDAIGYTRPSFHLVRQLVNLNVNLPKWHCFILSGLFLGWLKSSISVLTTLSRSLKCSSKQRMDFQEMLWNIWIMYV